MGSKICFVSFSAPSWFVLFYIYEVGSQVMNDRSAVEPITPSLRPRTRRRAQATLLFALLTFFATAATSTASAQTAAGARVSDSILGVEIGMGLEEARAKLKPLGTFGGRDTRGGGRKEQWTLKKTEFTYVVYQTDGNGKVKWVTGYVRPGKEMSFEKLGDLGAASLKTEQEATWNVERPEGNYRLMAQGSGGKARIVHLISLALPPM